MDLKPRWGKPKKKRHFDGCDSGGCDPCDCDVCDCDLCDLSPFSVFRLSTLLLTVAAVAPRHSTSADRIGVASIRGYQRWLSPRINVRCPHTPSCSRYGASAIRRYGLREGLRITASRLRRCNRAVPTGTFDPVP